MVSNIRPRSALLIASVLALSLGFVASSGRACTIFVLTDSRRTLFCNNEDYSNPNTRIWFVSAGENSYGCVYVGFDDGFPQGGMNTKGLAYDWVAGTSEEWRPDPTLPVSAGARQMLERCATVEEAISFFRRRGELGFFMSRIMVADRSGASAIIGAKEGALHVERSRQCRGFGYGEKTLEMLLGQQPPDPTFTNGMHILRACQQNGRFGTKYANIFDLDSGEIVLLPFPDHDDEVTLNLQDELKKGDHYYDIPEVRQQMTQAPRSLSAIMAPSLLHKYQPIADKEPEITDRVRRIWQDFTSDTVRATDQLPEARNTLSILSGRVATSMGRVESLTLVDRNEEAGKRSFRYRIQYKNAMFLQRFVFDDQGKLIAFETEDIQ